ncbi:MAG: hypothetical protein MJA29_08180, partial [Candidatus Omnitrophica bacterium]|nr:hypothetical protein [Candidatus Omnitrophota bacterium]
MSNNISPNKRLVKSERLVRSGRLSTSDSLGKDFSTGRKNLNLNDSVVERLQSYGSLSTTTLEEVPKHIGLRAQTSESFKLRFFLPVEKS